MLYASVESELTTPERILGGSTDGRQSGSAQGARIILYRVLIFAGLLLGLAPPAIADILQISATALVRRCPCPFGPTDDAEVTKGVLQSQQPDARYYIPVVFPRDGERVCRFSMVYRDVNANDTMTARLNRKTFTVGGDAFNDPIIMATLATASGVVDTVRRATTTNITRPAINTTKSFYFIEVDIPTVNLELLGFQIEVKPTC